VTNTRCHNQLPKVILGVNSSTKSRLSDRKLRPPSPRFGNRQSVISLLVMVGNEKQIDRCCYTRPLSDKVQHSKAIAAYHRSDYLYSYPQSFFSH
jgi:hypothetical protein